MRPSPQRLSSQQASPAPLRQTYDAMREQQLEIPATYEEFETSFVTDDQYAADLHAFFKEEKWDAPDELPKFRELMLTGVKKKDQPSSGAGGASSSTDALAGWTGTQDVGGAGEVVPAGTPVGVPADVNLPASGPAEQLAQPASLPGNYYNAEDWQENVRQQAGAFNRTVWN